MFQLAFLNWIKICLTSCTLIICTFSNEFFSNNFLRSSQVWPLRIWFGNCGHRHDQEWIRNALRGNDQLNSKHNIQVFRDPSKLFVNVWSKIKHQKDYLILHSIRFKSNLVILNSIILNFMGSKNMPFDQFALFILHFSPFCSSKSFLQIMNKYRHCLSKHLILIIWLSISNIIFI